MKKRSLLIILSMVLAIWSCNKKEEDPRPKSSEKEIISFNFNEFNPVVVGKIDTITHTIYLEVEATTDTKNLIPTIVIPISASISPSSGVVTDFTNPVTYTVTSEDNAKQEFTVTVKKQAPLPIVKYVDAIISGKDTISGIGDVVEWSSYHRIGGANFGISNEENKVFLIDNSGKTFSMTIVLSDTKFIGFLVPATTPLASGYKIKVVANGREVIFPKLLKVEMPAPAIVSIEKMAITAGDTLKITGTHFGSIPVNSQVMLTKNGTSVAASIIAITNTLIKAKVSDTTPFGEYDVKVSREGKDSPYFKDKITIGSKDKIVITGVNKTSFKRGETVIFTGQHFIKAGQSAFIIFDNTGDGKSGELYFGSSNSEGTQLSFTIPSDADYDAYTIQLTIDIKEYTDLPGTIEVIP